MSDQELKIPEGDEVEQEKARKKILKHIALDPRLAHEFLFPHRHPNITPEFHGEMIDIWHDETIQKATFQAFRGGAKSTVGCEEATIIMALFGVFKNGLLIGEKYERSVERLDAIKYELETNERINWLFGDTRGKVWKEGKISLFNDTVIQAIGRGQSMRGSKNRDQRPDYICGDDIEDLDSVRTEEAKKATLAWLISVVMPALDKEKYIIRIVGTPLETNSLMEKLSYDEGWVSRKFPIEYVDGEGNRVATWPDRFPLKDIDEVRYEFERLGLLLEYGREYMCEARSGETRQFHQDMMLVEPRVRRFEPVYSFHDPARTVNHKTSDHTGKVVFSWIGSELRIWEASGHFWRPDEIVRDIFEVNEKYSPVALGIEETGLNEFIMQPIRQEIVKQAIILPIRPMNAPKNKKDFIRGLQPFFMAHDVVMNQECPDLVNQLLNHPIGRDDVPNALAYALLMRPGLPIFEDFHEAHIISDYRPPKKKMAMAVNYDGGVITGVIFQKTMAGITIIDNVVIEGNPQQKAVDLLDEGYFIAGGAKNLDVFLHPTHYEKYSVSGFLGALRKAGCDPRSGGDVMKGRQYITEALRDRRNGRCVFRVDADAVFTINAMSAGYALEYKKGKGLDTRAKEGLYRTLMEGFESAIGVYRGAALDEDKNINYSVDKSGRRYVSTITNRK